MPQNQDFFAVPKLSFRTIIGGLSLFLISVNALTAIITIWTGGDYLGTIFWSSLNLFVAVLIAYFLIDKILVNKGAWANSLSLLLVVSMFLLSQYLILKPEDGDAFRSIFGGFLSYVMYIVVIALNILIATFTRTSKLVQWLGNITMVFAFFAVNFFAFGLVIASSSMLEIIDRLTSTFFVLTLFSAIAIPIAKLLERSIKKP